MPKLYSTLAELIDELNGEYSQADARQAENDWFRDLRLDQEPTLFDTLTEWGIAAYAAYNARTIH